MYRSRKSLIQTDITIIYIYIDITTKYHINYDKMIYAQ